MEWLRGGPEGGLGEKVQHALGFVKVSGHQSRKIFDVS